MSNVIVPINGHLKAFVSQENISVVESITPGLFNYSSVGERMGKKVISIDFGVSESISVSDLEAIAQYVEDGGSIIVANEEYDIFACVFSGGKMTINDVDITVKD